MTNKQTIAKFLKIKDFPFVIKDKNKNEIYHEASDGYWWKNEYDSNGNRIYYEDSDGDILDKRPKIIELTLQDIAKLKGVDASLIRIKE